MQETQPSNCVFCVFCLQKQMQPSSNPRLSLLCTCLVLIWQLSFGFAMKRKEAENSYGPYGCLRGWTRREGSCYRIFSDPLRWHDAMKTCRIFDPTSELASIQDMKELRRVSNMLLIPKELRVWIGLSVKDKDGNWEWTDGSVPEFLPWTRGEPMTSGINSCVYLFRGDVFLRFRAEDCRYEESYICEHKPASASS
ncbi:C-type lectin mannose-binding isoform-like isoform X1 [Podarcis raffonei]|uniref:C-type lectin mannose-binding isoform-like isoform X1 n=2 Tax=Podarcis raffonei TaxID=65483 RepID=UPI0023291FF4|nr:C-type lectin mannose-binding isoform-like isoform X1 [Podarcis raffonei]